MNNNKTILVNSWYATYIDGNVTELEHYLKTQFHPIINKLANKVKLVKGVLFFIAGKKFDIIITHTADQQVTATLIILEALFSSKKNRVVLLEFIQGTPQKRISRLIWPIWVKIFWGPGLRKTLVKAQVLTLKERELYANVFKVPVERFTFIPWPLHYNKERQLNEFILSNPFHTADEQNPQYVMVSGRANVDWETVFNAFKKSSWNLLAVCSARHLNRVNQLNEGKKAKVLIDISQEEHAFYVKNSTVYALCLEESDVSVGQVRLMNTIEHGVPVVVTKVAGLEGYAIDGVNSLIIPPNDADALKFAIDKLINNHLLREQLVSGAQNFQEGSTFEVYIEKIKNLITSV